MKAKYIIIHGGSYFDFFLIKFCAAAVYALSFYIFFNFSQNGEKKPLLSSGTAISYRTALSIPYAHVIRDDNIQTESSNVVEASATDILLFNGTMPDRTYQTRMY